MRLQRSWISLGAVLLIFLAACGPGTPTITPTATGLVNSQPLPLPNVVLTVVPPAFVVPACVPPVPTIGDVSSFCANPTKGFGGASFTDTTFYNTDNQTSWLSSDSIGGGASCQLDNGTSIGTCSGAQNGTLQAMVCGSCTPPLAPGPPVPGSKVIVCAQGWKLRPDQTTCAPTPPNTYFAFCPPGSHYDNALQNCADNVTNKLASPCPPDYPFYSPGHGQCSTKVKEVYHCQTFPIQLGACAALNPAKVVVKVVPFCQNADANTGGANITYPAGSTLVVDVKGSRLDRCTPGATQPDGTQLSTCSGIAGNTFDVQLCTDPATCTTYKATLGACAVKKNREGNPGPAPACGHC